MKNNIFDSEDDINKEHLLKIKKLFLTNQPVGIDISFEGQGLTEENNYKLGCRAGPQISVSNLIHEMSHLAEREVDKIILKPSHGWGFSYGYRWECLGKSGWESRNDKSVQREKRVWAYQFSIEKQLKIENTEDEESHAINLARSAVYMDAFMFYKNNVVDNNLPFNQKEQKAIEILAAEIEELSDMEFTFSRFEEEWFKRMNLLRSA